MDAKITRKQQAANIIEWLERLRNFKKTTRMLGENTRIDSAGGWKYCCLGVACRIQKLPDTNFENGQEDRLVDSLCLHDYNARFDKRVIVELPELDRADIEDAGKFSVSSLIDSNDDVFTEDKGFARQRAFMLLTTNRWIANKTVLEAVNKHFSKERKELAKKVKFKITKA